MLHILWNRALPLRRRLYVRIGIGITRRRVRMLFLCADKLTLIAGIRVDMLRLRGLLTDQHTLLVEAFIRVRVILAFLLPADQNPSGLIAFVRMLMNLRALLLPADQNARITLFAMRMLFLSAISLIRHRDRRQNQRIGRTEYDHSSQHRHCAAPSLLTQMRLQV